MNAKRAVIVGVIGLLLIADLAALNAVAVADRTVLDASFVKTALEEEGAYGELRSLLVEAAADAITEPDSGSASGTTTETLAVDPAEVVDSAVTRDYLQNQTETNIDQLYGYLHGERDELVIAVSLAPVKAGVAESVADQVRELTVGELFATATGTEGSFEIQGMTFDLTLIDRLNESEASYEAARAEFRAEIRERVVDQLVDEAFRTRSDDELLVLVISDYDPDAYTAEEKATLVEEREAAIRSALEATIQAEAGAEVDRLVDEERVTVRNQVRASLDQQLRDAQDIDPAVAEAATDLVMVGVDGLTTETTYATYTEELAAAKTRLADAVEVAIADQLDVEVPDQMDVSDQIGPEARQGIEAARSVVGVLGLLLYLLPLLGLGLLGLLWYATRSPTIVVAVAGVALLLAGLPGYFTATALPGAVRASLVGQAPTEIVQLVLGIVGHVTAAVASQSVAFVAVGVLAVLAAVALHAWERGLLDGVLGTS